MILLDAQSAYDKILIESVVKQAFLAGTKDQGLMYINNRLKNRKTYCEFNKTLMGPINDKLGLEQGGKSSDKFYRLCNREQLAVAQGSGLGVHMGGGPCGDVTVASVGQADDVVLMSSSIHNLRNLVQLTENYCDSFKVTLVPEKTKLLAFGPQTSLKLYWDKLT